MLNLNVTEELNSNDLSHHSVRTPGPSVEWFWSRVGSTYGVLYNIIFIIVGGNVAVLFRLDRF